MEIDKDIANLIKKIKKAGLTGFYIVKCKKPVKLDCFILSKK
jgi:hypothetical protein